MEELSTKEKLILVGMDELREYGYAGFSLRRVAAKCGLSCAAPYKHFSGKDELFSAMADYINEKWRERIRGKVKLVKPVEALIADLASDHVSFLCENPDFKSVLLIKETGLDTPLAARATSIDPTLARLFVIYRRKYRLTRENLRARIFLVRTIMYGASIIMDSDDNNREERLRLVRTAVLRTLKLTSQS